MAEQETEDEMLEGNGGDQPGAFRFDRDKVMEEPKDSGDLTALANSNVTVYSAAALEQGMLQQVERTFARNIADAQSTERSNFERLHDLIVENANANATSVKHGDMTPFEVLNKTRNTFSDDAFEGLKTDDEGKIKAIVKSEESSESSSVSGSDFVPENVESESSEGEQELKLEMKSVVGKKDRKKIVKKKRPEKERDDANDEDFQERIRTHLVRTELSKIEGGENEIQNEKGFHELTNDIRVPNDCWTKLYRYQKTGVRWLNELHEQCVGGILADEMGLGKTVQIISFLKALAFSRLTNRGFSFSGLGPVLIICPATIMHQWLKEFHAWFPLCRVAVLHSSGSFHGRSTQLIQKMVVPRSDGSVLLTSYGTFTRNRKRLVDKAWHYVILDEGHKIRNPEAQVTLAVKEVRTPHRLILSGSPLQNSLRELWSLVDFVYPGRLGSLKSFMEKFSIPITQGGYSNASALQVRTAYKCACVLRDAINPYLLRRLKKDVEMSIQLPTKTEQVLFCDITPCQRSLYQEYLSSRECGRILSGKMDAFVGLIILRKLCNHPDLVTGGTNKFNDYDVTVDEEMDFGASCRSGKMQVLKALLKLWKRQGQKVLLFSQSRQMLTVLEKFVIREGYEYLRMDGSTPVGKRQPLVEKFNKEGEIFIFLLTTRVGGQGINLTGANRVVIFDPDWNPSTDMQARERAWRIGQERAVTVYRLLTGGTIEEKIYHRSSTLTSINPTVYYLLEERGGPGYNTLFASDAKVLKKEGTETAAIFSNAAKNFTRYNFFDKNEKDRQRRLKNMSRKRKKLTAEATSDDDEDAKAVVEEHLSAEKIAELRELARKISRSISKKAEQRMEVNEGQTGRNKRRKELDDDGSDADVRIPYLQKKRRYKEKKAEEVSGQDDYVLRKLLTKAGVISALQHDQIFTETVADEQLIEDEANAVAARAASSIRRSRRFMATKPPEEPKFGLRKAAGFQADAKNDDTDEEEPNFCGAALLKENTGNSGSLLDAIRRRKQRTMDIQEEAEKKHLEEEYPSLFDVSASTSSKKADKYEKLAEDVRLFMMHRKGQALTDEILQGFKNRVRVEDSFAFRSILKRLCILQKNSNLWMLRDEYQ